VVDSAGWLRHEAPCWLRPLRVRVQNRRLRGGSPRGQVPQGPREGTHCVSFGFQGKVCAPTQGGRQTGAGGRCQVPVRVQWGG